MQKCKTGASLGKLELKRFKYNVFKCFNPVRQAQNVGKTRHSQDASNSAFPNASEV